MLTKDLILCRLTNGRLNPRFISDDDPEWLDIAARLVDAYDDKQHLLRSEIEEMTSQVVAGTKNLKLAKGLLKVIDDQAEFSSPIDLDYEASRLDLFRASAEILRQCPGLDEASFQEELRRRTAGNPLSGKSIFADLPDNDRLVKLDFITPCQVLQRYNCALVQGLLLRASEMQLTVKDGDPAKLRRVFKYLKFFRLLAKITATRGGMEDVDELSISIDGPASLFDQSKRYGFQLACFFPAVCGLDKWRIRACVEWRDAKRFLVLDETSGLVSHYRNFSAYVPEEIQMFHGYFQEKVQEWRILATTPFVRGHGNEVIFPDFSFENSDGGTVVHLELFHRWHSRPLISRLEWMSKHPEVPLIIGVDRSLLKDQEIQDALDQSEQFASRGFLFKDYPTVERTLKCLNGFKTESSQLDLI